MKLRLGDVLVQEGIISPQQLSVALEHQRRHPGFRKLGETVLALRLTTEDRILEALERALGVEAIDLRRLERIPPDALDAIDVDTAERELVLPLRFEHVGTRRKLALAMADPTNLAAVDDLQFRLGVTVSTSLSTITQIRDAINRFYRGGGMAAMGLDVDLTRADSEEHIHLIQDWEQQTWVGQPPGPALAVPIVELKVFSGPLRGRSIKVEDGASVVLGRGQDADLVIPDHRMSRRHCQVTARLHSVEVTDMGSSNGTFVNKKQVSRAVLHHGDWIQAGNTLVKVVIAEPG